MHFRTLPAVMLLFSTINIVSFVPAYAQSVIYVDDDAPPGGTGLSWAAAYNALQDALDVAAAGDEIWVASGTYTPDRGTEDREASFQLVNRVEIYGGFAGNEGNRNERDVAINTSILSGDLLDNDVAVLNLADLHTDPSRADNSYHVVSADTTVAGGVLDGFTISGGTANGPDPHNGGGGFFNVGGDPLIVGCTFTANAASYGGAMRNSLLASPILTNCAFSGNWAELRGGAILNTEASQPSLVDCTFTGNEAGGAGVGDGGAVNNVNDSSPTLTNCSFDDNHAGNVGGAMYSDGGNATLTNCTFTGNLALRAGGGVYNLNNSNPTLTDCSFDGNSAPGPDSFSGGAGCTTRTAPQR